MLVIGLVLLVVGLGGGALLAYLAAQTGQTVSLTAGPLSIGLAPVTLVVAGALAVVLVWAGARLGAVGARRQRRQRHELKEQRRQVKDLRATTGSSGPTAAKPTPPTTTPGPTPRD